MTLPAADTDRHPRFRHLPAVVVIPAVAVALLLAGLVVFLLWSKATESPWGKSAAQMAREHTSCAAPVENGSVARCEGFQVVTSKSASEQAYLVAMLKDQGGECWAAIPGVVVVSNQPAALLRALGEAPARWADKHGGTAGCS